MTDLTHLDAQGHAHMVDVGHKPATARRAVAQGHVRVAPTTIQALRDGRTPKGDVLAAARIAGIMAAKRTAELLPLCHPVALTHVSVTVELAANEPRIEVTAEARTTGPTGVEMEALTAVSIAALTLYDMLKGIDRGIVIGGIELIEKVGGRSTDQLRPVKVVPKSPPPAPALPAPETGLSVQSWHDDEVGLMAPEGGHGTDALPLEVDATFVGLSGDVAAVLEPAPLMAPIPPALRLAAEPPRLHPASRAPAAVLSVPPTPSPNALARVDRAVRLAATDPRLPRFLGRDRIDSAYMLGDLDLPYAEHCTWYGAVDEGALTAVVLLYTGLSMPTLLTAGDPIDVEAVLAAFREHLPHRLHGHIRSAHRHGVEAWYDLSGTREMVRMGLTRGQYTPTGDPSGVEVIGHRDTGHLMALYQHYPDNFFDPAQLDSGLYFGIREAGELVSAAGVHVVSDRHDVAAIGNIVTHGQWRSRGLATRCVRAILDRLFERVGNVALNVESDNPSAVALYRKFGFTERFGFLESTLALR